jgi:hypothetical protein
MFKSPALTEPDHVEPYFNCFFVNLSPEVKKTKTHKTIIKRFSKLFINCPRNKTVCALF